MTGRLNYFEGEIIRLMRGLDADEKSTALRMMRRYVELLPEIPVPDDEHLDRGPGEDQ